jgi:hypothetical protein
MMNAIEALLARLTGRSAWPTVAAVVDHLHPGVSTIGSVKVPGARGVDTTDIFRYEVDGTEYIRSIHEVVGDIPLTNGEHIHIQYNPNRPSQSYYGPNRQLASRALVFAVIAGCVAIVVVSMYLRR